MRPKMLALDIETAADMEAVTRLAAKPPELKAPSNYKDEAKIAAYLEEAREKWYRDLVEKAALSPLTGRVVSVALWDGEDGGATSLRETAGDEATLLRQTWAAFLDYDGVVTFNGWSFDLPFVMLRSAMHGLAAPATRLTTPRYQYHPHCDLRMFLTQWDSHGQGKLDEWCAAFGVPCAGKALGITGADIGQMVEDGRWEEIEAYNLGDAKATWDLWLRLRPWLPAPAGTRHSAAPSATMPALAAANADRATADAEVA